MTKQTAADREAPLTDDILLTERVSHLLGQAHRRQIWMMFLDEDDVQAPLIIPCADLPSDPGETFAATGSGDVTAADALAWRVSALMEELPAAQAVFSWERPGGPQVGAEERAWARGLGAACARAGVRVRAQFVVHDRGVRVLAPDDYA